MAATMKGRIKRIRGPRDAVRKLAVDRLMREFGVTRQFVSLSLLPEERLRELAEQGDKLSPKGYAIRAAFPAVYEKIKQVAT